jgi:TctA family transporter
MDLLNNLLLGFATASSAANIGFCFLGVLLGTLIGVLPGIGPTATIAMLLPVTIQIGDPVSSMIMLAGIYYGAQYGGSTRRSSSTCRARRRRRSPPSTAIRWRAASARASLAVAAIGSFVAGTFAALLIAIFAVPLTEWRCALVLPNIARSWVVGLVCAAALARLRPESPGDGGDRASAHIIGLDVYSGTPRFNLGLAELSDGLSFVAVAVGVFRIARSSATEASASATFSLPRLPD